MTKRVFITYANNQLKKRDLKTDKEKILLQNQKFHRSLDLSPDGNKLLFCVGNELMVIPTSGGKAKKLFSVAESNKIRHPIWSPTGDYIFLIENMNNLDDGGVLWRVSAKGKKPIQVWRSKKPISSISIHPDGQEVVLSTFGHEMEVWKVDNLLQLKETDNK